jgi:hypothetical protein
MGCAAAVPVAPARANNLRQINNTTLAHADESTEPGKRKVVTTESISPRAQSPFPAASPQSYQSVHTHNRPDGPPEDLVSDPHALQTNTDVLRSIHLNRLTEIIESSKRENQGAGVSLLQQCNEFDAVIPTPMTPHEGTAVADDDGIAGEPVNGFAGSANRSVSSVTATYGDFQFYKLSIPVQLLMEQSSSL